MKKSSEFDRLMQERLHEVRDDAFETGENDDILQQLRGITNSGATNALSVLSSKEIRIGAFVWTRLGLRVDGEVTEQDYEEVGHILRKFDQSMQWLIGDFIVAGEDLGYGDQKRIAEYFGFQHSTIRDYAYVARNVEMSVRIDTLEFGHHRLVAPLPTDQQYTWLNRAETGDGDGQRWSVARLRQEIKDAHGTQERISVQDRLDQIYTSQRKQADKLVGEGASREAVARIYERIAQEIRGAQDYDV